jgi:HK97 family phage major capsid protein
VRDIDILKDSQNQYLHRGIWGDRPNVANVPILETTAINEGDFLVGDFRLGATLWDRKQALVKFSDSDQDNFIKNVVTVVFEERLAQTVERPNAFVYGNFATAKACGSG